MYSCQSLFCACVRMRCTLRPVPHWPAADWLTQFSTCLLSCDCGSRVRRCVGMVSVISGHFSSQTLLNGDRQCCELWRDAELRVVQRVLWVIWLTKTLSRSVVLFATLWHCRELSDERYARHSQCKFWMLWQLTPAVTVARPTIPAVRSVGAVYHAVCQLASRLLQPLVTTVGDILALYIML